jgi:hypothetical protein
MNLKRIFTVVLIGALFFVGVQFAAVFFYAWAFEDFVKDEVKFTPMREPAERVHLVEHILNQAQSYSLAVDPGDVAVEKHTDTNSGITTLQVNVSYMSPVDLYYFTYHLRRNLLAKTTY